ncbi:uncharacterized protein G2W53_030624 [Senna tora]|uniref:Uncharacterized protein n=1 Tax=Senna tora TaxID=362788 RepID=A0A834T7F4_9FABA|nr:uncharacterized protein G2W53_030624 [Senna tora]
MATFKLVSVSKYKSLCLTHRERERKSGEGSLGRAGLEFEVVVFGVRKGVWRKHGASNIHQNFKEWTRRLSKGQSP